VTKPVNPCAVCIREMAGTPDYGRIVCTACQHGLTADLAAILEAAATAAYTPATFAAGGEGIRRPAPSSRPPVSLGHIDPALTSIDEVKGDHSTETTVLALLESWTRMWRNTTRLTKWGIVTEPTGPGVPGVGVTLAVVVRDLRSQLPVMAADPRFPIEELADHIRRCLGVLRALDRSIERAASWRVPCPSDVDDGVCGRRITVEPGDLHGDLWCASCRTTWTPQRLLLVALNDARVSVWGYPADISAALGIPARTLRRWGEQDLVQRRGSLYDAGAAFRMRHAGAA